MRKLLAGLLTTSILTVSVFGSSIYAKDNYKQAYTKFFNRESINWGVQDASMDEIKFSFMDIDRNGVPEVVLEFDNACAGDGMQHVFQYKNGKIVQMIPSQYGSAVTLYKNGMVCVSGGKQDGFYDTYYKVKNNRARFITEKCESQYYDDDSDTLVTSKTYVKGKHEWEDGATVISEKQFKKLTSGCVKKNVRKLSFHDATARNVKKYLKSYK